MLKRKKVVVFLICILLILPLVYILVTLVYSKNIKKELSITSYDKVQQSYNSDNIEAVPKNVDAVVPVFMYHFVTDKKIDAVDIENYITTRKLEEQIKYIVDNNYEPIYISEFDKLHKYTKPVAITIDDGFLFYDTTFHILKKYNVKATLNIIINYIDNPGYLTKEQIREIISSGLVEVQSHTLSHRKLASLSIKEMEKEIVMSYAYIKENFGIDSSVLCYPIGSYSKKTIEIAKKSYKYGLMMDGGVFYSNKHNLYEIPRIYVSRSMPINKYAAYLKTSKVDVEW